MLAQPTVMAFAPVGSHFLPPPPPPRPLELFPPRPPRPPRPPLPPRAGAEEESRPAHPLSRGFPSVSVFDAGF